MIAARPSMGKSALGLGVAANLAVRKEIPVALFTLEMSKSEVTQRLMCSEAKVESQRLRTGKLSADDWPRLTAACDKLAKAPIYVDDTGSITMMEIRSKARRLKSKHPDLGLIIVDYMQLMTSGTTAENRVQEVSQISRSLKVLARDLDVPIVALSQLSRAVEQRHDKRPILSDLRESGSIEQDADIVMFIYRDEYYNAEESDQQGLAEVIVAKHRNGPTDTVKLSFLKRYAKFSDLAPPDRIQIASGAPCRIRRPASEEGPWREPRAADHPDDGPAPFLPRAGNPVGPTTTLTRSMIARWWRGWAATQENADAYEELLKTTILPWVGSHEGHRGSYLVRRDVEDGVEFATLTLWESLDSGQGLRRRGLRGRRRARAGPRRALALGRALGALRGGGQPRELGKSRPWARPRPRAHGLGHRSRPPRGFGTRPRPRPRSRRRSARAATASSTSALVAAAACGLRLGRGWLPRPPPSPRAPPRAEARRRSGRRGSSPRPGRPRRP